MITLDQHSNVVARVCIPTVRNLRGDPLSLVVGDGNLKAVHLLLAADLRLGRVCFVGRLAGATSGE